MVEKYESRRIRIAIRHVLMDVWDPIGVKDEPNAQDEYDGYLGGVYELLVTGASDESIEDHLWRIVTERMELSAKKSDMANTVISSADSPTSEFKLAHCHYAHFIACSYACATRSNVTSSKCRANNCNPIGSFS